MKRGIINLGIMLGTFLALGQASAGLDIKVVHPTSLEIVGYGEVSNTNQNKFTMKLLEDYSGPVEVLIVDTDSKDFFQYKGTVDKNILSISFPTGAQNLKAYILAKGLEFKQFLVAKQNLALPKSK
jgi:hypothetical protein